MRPSLLVDPLDHILQRFSAAKIDPLALENSRAGRHRARRRKEAAPPVPGAVQRVHRAVTVPHFGQHWVRLRDERAQSLKRLFLM